MSTKLTDGEIEDLVEKVKTQGVLSPEELDQLPGAIRRLQTNADQVAESAERERRRRDGQ